MVQVRQDDLLRALKSFKGLAKQDLLVSNQTTPEIEYRKTHAEARRETYAKLISLVEESGIEEACVFAFQEYFNFASDSRQKDSDPVRDGHLQALEMFFKVMGVTGEKLNDPQIKNLDIHELLSIQVPQAQTEYCM